MLDPCLLKNSENLHSFKHSMWPRITPILQNSLQGFSLTPNWSFWLRLRISLWLFCVDIVSLNLSKSCRCNCDLLAVLSPSLVALRLVDWRLSIPDSICLCFYLRLSQVGCRHFSGLSIVLISTGFCFAEGFVGMQPCCNVSNLMPEPRRTCHSTGYSLAGHSSS